ncbi:hypothetical protein ZMO1_ZMO1398 [Zymomonas mobilis subsp. mobilis ZM4 = ATCC 31821]|uniref:Lipoprotein n=2 Tax=Zymomonas mobilis subsp. mobilis TaxID=120045 RepID=Q5NMN8_ZYMMO|nr:hypothetical protein [Zymomonas mobilis]AAV90022.1 hypothetical protein ZMO1398 [Zymomonas mobilis subsp. mobilis ZM4 = ATCC 31821]ACV76323.1 hypothetical protein Za10_1789 [Zymomonas mobilis subsp. mobilis NCIMB 11163]AEH63522.1 conserved hypothetical protein [Zymomonas mobilis subsp. mobilis ATCC 10988]AHB11000.1 hypothetical protein ZCP4_1733 [Zymomonas mobilis subsp. mobilis str. CP4 = NRRL B-14023]AHJ71315.1 hypothetical protein A254_01730 [Zymomonas mobilis subsp. mobilis NRRL B-12526
MKINRCMSALSKTVLLNTAIIGLVLGNMAVSGCKDKTRDLQNATLHPDTDIALGTINDEMASESIFEEESDNSIQATSLPAN